MEENIDLELNWQKNYLEDLKKMKKKEDKNKKLSNGRRKWFNKEISKTKQKIENLSEKLNNQH